MKLSLESAGPRQAVVIPTVAIVRQRGSQSAWIWPVGWPSVRDTATALVGSTSGTVGGGRSSLDGVGERLRLERVKAGLSQRELARRLGVSASLISQVENGSTKASVGTLWAIVTELGLSLDRVIRGDISADSEDTSPSSESRSHAILHPDDRKAIDLASGVRWEDLNANPEDELDFVLAIYEVGGASTPDQSLMRHHGREYGYVIAGTLGIQVAFRDYVLEPGDSIAFDSTEPHRLYNLGDIPVEAVWFVLGRSDDHAVDRS